MERSKSDASVLIITYTCSHNHPGPDVSSTTKSLSQPVPPKEEPNSEDDDHDFPAQVPKEEEQEQDQDEEQEQERKLDEEEEQDHFHYIQSPIRFSQDIVIYQEDPFSTVNHLEKTLLDEHPHPLCYSQLMSFSTTPKLEDEEEEDFYDELEELLPTSSYFPSFMRSNLSQLERIPFVPS